MQLFEANKFSRVTSLRIVASILLLFSASDAHRANEVEFGRPSASKHIESSLEQWYNNESRKRFTDKDTTSLYIYNYAETDLVSVLTKISELADLEDNNRKAEKFEENFPEILNLVAESWSKHKGSNNDFSAIILPEILNFLTVPKLENKSKVGSLEKLKIRASKQFERKIKLDRNENSCGDNFRASISPTSFVRNDSTIRLFGSLSESHCVYKKYTGWIENQDLFYSDCDINSSNPSKRAKYKWEFDQESGQIFAVDILTNPKFCWKLADLNRFTKQRVKISRCAIEGSANYEKQQFVYLNGRIHAKNSLRNCVGIELHSFDQEGPLFSTDCYASLWGDNLLSKTSCSETETELLPIPFSLMAFNASSEDRDDHEMSFRPFGENVSTFDGNGEITGSYDVGGHSGLCIEKLGVGYVKDDNVAFNGCKTDANNALKLGKKQWIYDETTGQIFSYGSQVKNAANPFCLYVNNINRYYKQRVRIARCDSSDSRQAFDYVDGRVHLRDSPRHCLSYIVNEVEQSNSG